MSDTEYFHHEVKLVDLHTKRVFYDKMNGWEKGPIEEKRENVRNLKKLGVAVDIIFQATGLTPEEIEGIS